MKSYRCLICGYIHVGENPPENCPVCDASSEEFEIYEEKVEETKQSTSSWRCLNCEYVHDGSNPPDVCPVCGVKSDMFEPHSNGQKGETSNESIKIVIVGGGIAGLSCAEEIRNNSDKAEITLISADEVLPYYRLNLTRYLAKETDRGSLTIYPESFYKEKRINLISGLEISEIQKDVKQVKLSDGSEIAFDKLVIANGAHPFIPPIAGKELGNVITVRKIEDADFLLEKMDKIKSCICIGAGILGLETAGAIAKSGVKVTLLEGSDWLMPRQLNRKAAELLTEYLKEIGVEVKANSKVQEITGDNECKGIKLSTGEVLPTELVIITAGVRPNTHLARKAGLEVNMGVVVNNRMKTSEEDIFAAGDVTEHYGTLYGLWNVAQFQGKIAAQNLVGMNSEFGGVPRSNVLKVLGLDMFSIGEFMPKDGSYYQYEKQTQDGYIYFVVRDGRIVGSIIIGDKNLSIKVKQAVEKGLNFPHEIYDDVESIVNKLINNKTEETKMSGKKTNENLMAAFAGESQANRKYLAFAKKAEAEGKMNAAKLFRAAADAETLHAMKEFELAGKINSTVENLKDAMAGETHEYKEMYPDFIEVAKGEEEKGAIGAFTLAMKAEEVHARLYKEALDNLDTKEEVFYYLCPVCGNIEKFVPDKCSICGVPGDKFIKY